MSASWKASLPCTRGEAEALDGDLPDIARLDAPPVLMGSESDGGPHGLWRLDAYFDHEPGREELDMLCALVPSAAGRAPEVERLSDRDWVRLSQAGLEPVRAGRFFVHTPAFRDAIPPDAVALEIDAGLAFGTGQHETTTGCLLALDRLKGRGARFANLIDLGTGTGLLAFAALKLWPDARAAASDIDPVAVDVAADNAAVNAVPVAPGAGAGAGALELVVAAGLDHDRLRARAPFDLILANILAGPLIDLAPSLAAALHPGGQIILAGLLGHQADAVTDAYRRHGLAASFRIDRGDWPTLAMRKRKALGWQ